MSTRAKPGSVVSPKKVAPGPRVAVVVLDQQRAPDPDQRVVGGAAPGLEHRLAADEAPAAEALLAAVDGDRHLIGVVGDRHPALAEQRRRRPRGVVGLARLLLARVRVLLAPAHPRAGRERPRTGTSLGRRRRRRRRSRRPRTSSRSPRSSSTVRGSPPRARDEADHAVGAHEPQSPVPVGQHRVDRVVLADRRRRGRCRRPARTRRRGPRRRRRGGSWSRSPPGRDGRDRSSRRPRSR